MTAIRVGTRGSQLALTQTGHVVEALKQLHAHLTVELVVIKTTGDVRTGVPFTQVGTKGMFVKEIEEALLAGDIDVGVHSLKDMPGELPDGLELAATPRREDPRDALLSRGAGVKLGHGQLARDVVRPQKSQIGDDDGRSGAAEPQLAEPQLAEPQLAELQVLASQVPPQ